MSASSLDVTGFDLRALPDGFYEDPYPYYRALRERAPVHRCPEGGILLTRYADVLAAYRDHARLSSDKRAEFHPKFGDGPLYEHHTTSLVFRDPPKHTTVRKLIHHFFTPRALAALESRVCGLVDDMLDRFEQTRAMDLVGDYAFSLPAEVVCDLLGVPAADRSELRAWARAILGALEPVVAPAVVNRGNEAVTAFGAYLRELVAHKRTAGAGSEVDVLSTLIDAVDWSGRADGCDSPDRLTETDLVHNCIFMLNAGHETTTNLIANGVNALLEHPHAARALRENPDLIHVGVDELLRFESSNQLGNRRAVESVEIGGTKLEPGTLVTLVIGAANRDPAQFPSPDTLALDRQPNRHLAFAAGIHTCAGANLARMEARIAIGRLTGRFHSLHKTAPVERDRRARFRVVRRMAVAA